MTDIEQRERVLQLVELPPADNNEISLYELIRIVIEQRYLIALFVATLLLGAVAYVSTKPDVYSLTTALAVGKRVDDAGHVAPLESTATLQAKLKTTYIPVVRNDYIERDPTQSVPLVDIEIPKESDVVVLSSKVTQQQLPQAVEIHQAVVSSITRDHDEQLALPRKLIELAIEQAKIDLTRLQQSSEFAVATKTLASQRLQKKQELSQWQDDALFVQKRKPIENQLLDNQQQQRAVQEQIEIVKQQIERLNTERDILLQEIADTKDYIKTATQGRQQAVDKNAERDAAALMVLLVDGDIQKSRQQLAELERKLNIQLAESKAQLNKNLEDLQRQQVRVVETGEVIKAKLFGLDQERQQLLPQLNIELARIDAEIAMATAEYQRHIDEQQQKLNELSFRLEKFSSTRALAAPVQSPEPIGPKRGLIVGLALLAGLLLGVVVGFMRHGLLSMAAVNKPVSADEDVAADASSATMREDLTESALASVSVPAAVAEVSNRLRASGR